VSAEPHQPHGPLVPDAAAVDPAFFRMRESKSRFRLIGAAVERMVITHRVVDLCAAWLLWRLGAGWWAAAWFVASTALHAARLLHLRHWRRRGDRDHERADRWLGIYCVAMGFMWALAFVLAFMQPVAPEHYALTMLCLTLTVDTVFAAGWQPKVFAGWAAPLGLVLGGAWLWRGGDLGFGMAIISVGHLVTMTGFAAAQSKALRRRVSLSIENEQLTSRLRVERDRAEAASHARTRFLAAGSHDLRQPLHALSINAATLSLLSKRLQDPLLSEVSGSIGRALRHSNGVLDGLLDISRLDAGVVRPEPQNVDLALLLVQLRDELAPVAAQRGLALRLEVPRPGMLTAHVDPDLLVRLLRHLAGNALKFTAQGHVVIGAEALPAAAGAATLARLFVDDSGPGIPLESQEQVFEEFSQLGNPSRDRSQGLGLGLAIVRRLSGLMALPLTLTSAPGQGTRFELRIPLAAAQGLPVAAEAPLSGLAVAGVAGVAGVAAGSAMDDHRLRGLRVLAIDDEPDIVRSLVGLLTHMGSDARGASGRDEAVALVAGGFRPDLVIADHRLRGHSGLEAITAVCAYTGPVPALVVTGDTAPQTILQAMSGGYPVIHKPVDGERLARALAALDLKPGSVAAQAPVAD
jgi:signal transduction histidine kinase/ActR/RegA family two-component response regulator